MKRRFLIFFLFPVIVFSQKIDVNTIIKNVQKKYDSMKDVYGDFKHSIIVVSTGMTGQNKGKIYFKKDNSFRIEYDEEIIVTDEISIWTYSKRNKQLLIDNFKKSRGTVLPSDLLFKYPENYNSELIGEENIENKKCYLLKLLPKNLDSFVQLTRVWVDSQSWIIIKVEQTDINKTVTTYMLSNIIIDGGISDNVFKFEVPDGTEVVDMRKKK